MNGDATTKTLSSSESSVSLAASSALAASSESSKSSAYTTGTSSENFSISFSTMPFSSSVSESYVYSKTVTMAGDRTTLTLSAISSESTASSESTNSLESAISTSFLAEYSKTYSESSIYESASLPEGSSFSSSYILSTSSNPDIYSSSGLSESSDFDRSSSSSGSYVSQTASQYHPVLTGATIDKHPDYNLTIGGELGPWTELSFEITLEGVENYTYAELFVDNVLVDAKINIEEKEIYVFYKSSVEVSSDSRLHYSGVYTASGSPISYAEVTIVKNSDLAKRDSEVFNLEWILDYKLDPPSSGSGALQTTSVYTISSSSSSSTDGISTTTFTSTSCESASCSESTITTGYTVVTSTLKGVVTEYTTYCPLDTSNSNIIPTTVETGNAITTSQPTIVTSIPSTVGATNGKENTSATIVVTVTSCKGGACTQTPVTTVFDASTNENSGISTFTTHLIGQTSTIIPTSIASTKAILSISSNAQNITSAAEITIFEAGASRYSFTSSVLFILISFLFI